MNQKKIWNILAMAIWLLQLAAEALTAVTVWRLDMLPDRYLWLVIAALMLVWSLTGLLLFLPSRKSGGGKLRRGLACFLALAVVLGCMAVASVVSDLYETIDQITQNPSDNAVTRTVYVRADDPAQTLEDARDYAFARVEGYDETYILQTIEKISGTVGKDIEVRTYPTIRAMVDALYAGEVDAIILNSANVDMLEDDEAYADFSEKTRELHETAVEQVTEPDAQQPTEPGGELDNPLVTLPSIEEPEEITNTPFVVYIGGSDSNSSRLTTGRNDVNILAVVNPETKQILLLNTPRDYYIGNPAGGGALDKLTHCGNDGVENSMKALAALYGIRVDYYARINFSGFETLVDAIGGITVYSDVAFTATDGTWFQAGENVLNGKQALTFARERYAFADGDNARGRNQMKVITAVIRKLTSGSTILSNYAGILDSMTGMFATNMEMAEISQLVKMQLDDMASWNIVSYAVTGSGGSAITYSDPGNYLYVTYPNEETVEHAKTLIAKVANGEILTDADVNP